MRPPHAWKLIDGILFLGKPWASPQIALQASALRSVCLLGTVGGSDADASFTIGFFFGNVRVTFERCLPASWRERAAAWAERTAERLNAERVTAWARWMASPGALQPEESSPIYAYQLDPFSPLGRINGVAWHGWMITAYLWSNGDWSRSDAGKAPWNGNGWTWHLNLERLIFGREVRRARRVAYGPALVHMPEGFYPGSYEIEEVEVSRPRARTTRHWLGKIEVPDGIPFPGKGESSHDCGEDAAFGLGEVYDHRPTVFDLQDALAASVTRSRERHGGKGWTPRERTCPIST